MKLKRIELSEFKRFSRGIVLDDLTPGLNLFVGANEAGKSTVAAAVRAAFLERYKTTKVAHFAPEGLGQARPTVRIEFETAGQDYVLSKTFLHRARCELMIGTRRLEGEQAEETLATLLGFEFPQKGQSKPMHAGVPGLLWITQGTSQDVAEAAQHAATHLRSALTQLTGALAATDGDKVFERVQTERGLLLDARNAKPKGPYREAEDALVHALQRQADAQAQQSALEADVDKLSQLRAAHDAELRDPPWLPMQTRAADARARLAALAQEAQGVERAESALAQAQANAALLAEHVARDEADLLGFKKLAAERDAAVAQTSAAQANVTRAQAMAEAAAERLTSARSRLENARVVETCRLRQAQHAAAGDELDVLRTRLSQADALVEDIATLRAQRDEWHYQPGDLQSLREGTLKALRLQTRVDAMATRLQFRLDAGQTISIDGVAVEGSGERSVIDPLRVEIAGVGEFSILPAGDDAAQIMAQLERVRQDNAACLERLGVSTLEAGEARAREHERVLRDLDFAQKKQALHAPEGMDVLRASVQQRSERVAELARELAAMAPPDLGAVPEQTLASFEQQVDALQTEAGAARERWREAQTVQETARAQAAWLDEQYRLRTTGDVSEQEARERQARRERLLDARTQTDVLARAARQARAAFAAQQPELIEQDALRFERSARLAQDAHQSRLAQLQQLKGKLEQAATQGSGESLSECRAEVERLTRRRDDIALRASALTLLHERLGAQRETVTRQLFAPLAKRLNHYLRLLFPSASIRIGDDLSPHALEREASAASLDSLSFGTQEQLGVLTRLAYADVLKEAGRPTLIVLDDALVHTDRARREQMKRALFDASTRHQILMLTCHAEDWRDMGVGLREL